MARTNSKDFVTIEVTYKEMKMITMALSGVLRNGERASAQELSVEILEQYEHALNERLSVVSGAARKAREAMGDTGR